MLILLCLLFVKHFVVDFLLQRPYQYENKGTYGHWGGIQHAGLHGLFTFAIFAYLSNPLVGILFGAADMVTHYHIDWATTKLTAKFELGPTHEKFWWLFGLDQLLHALTYIGLVTIVVVI